ncbi:MAG: Rrf2 family transcriptional regulator [Elusimicrobia bacterium]|nr:Rrf2 family transcriptional regulator [Elusimicrobiota bacterium]
MVGILNISEGSTIGLHAAVHLAKSPDEPVTTKEAAEAMKVSAAHLSKIMQRLARAGILRAVRGPRGGYLLSRPLNEIRLLDVFEAIEGPLKLSRCLLSQPRCGIDGCMLGDMMGEINRQVVKHFEKKLSEL